MTFLKVYKDLLRYYRHNGETMKQAQALTVMLSGASVFLTGPPGAGKTYVLNEFIGRAKKQGKHVAVTASTGIAATHIGGSTIHSWSGLGIRDSLSDADREWLRKNLGLRKRYLATDILVIVEVSMLHGKRLDMINEVSKLLREDSRPFGNLQVILVGDLFQLPPVSRGNEPQDFVHTSAAWQELGAKICYLTEQHRQQNDRLLEILEAMRDGEVEQWHTEALQERLGVRPDEDEVITRLYAHNIDVEAINDRRLASIPETGKSYSMETKGAANKIEQLVRGLLAPETLTLKTGAEVMFVANNFAEGFVNGSRGTVIGFQDDLPLVTLMSTGKTIRVNRHSWTLMEDEAKKAEAVQLPLRLAWAITIHKSQGMSLDAAEIDLGKTFTPGMGYVALSRVRSLKGIYLTGINRMAMQLHPDIFTFDAELRSASSLLAEQTPEASEEPEEDQAPVISKPLLDSLKDWRTNEARTRKIPPYMVAHDTELESIAIRQPHTSQQLLAISGFGEQKVSKYASDILRIVNDHADDEV